MRVSLTCKRILILDLWWNMSKLIGRGWPQAVSVDTETIGLRGPAFVVSAYDGRKVYCWIAKITVSNETGGVSWSGKQLQQMRKVLHGKTWIGHNIGLFDMARLNALGLSCKDYIDTLPASHVYNSLESHDLKDLETKYLGQLRDDESRLKAVVEKAKDIVKACRANFYGNKRSKVLESWFPSDIYELARIAVPKGAWQESMWLVPLVFPKDKTLEEYARYDAGSPYKLWVGQGRFPGYEKLLKGLGLYGFYETHIKYHQVVLDMKGYGVRLFVDKAHRRLDELTRKADKIRTAFDKQKVLVSSPQQLSKFLFYTLKFPVIKASKSEDGFPSTDRDVINALLEKYPDHRGVEWVKLLQKFREHATDIDDVKGYIESQDGGIIQVNINPTATDTTRGSCTDPNLQNVNKLEDRTLRYLFGPRNGMWWYSFDMKQLELNILAFMSGDQTLLRWLEEDKNVFVLLGEAVCENAGISLDAKKLKGIGKTLTYAICYGAGPEKAAATIRVRTGVTIPNPKVLHDTFFELFPGIRDFQARAIYDAQDKGYVFTAHGYRLFVPENEPHAAVDYRVQGAAGWLIKEASVRIRKFLAKQGADKIKFLLDVHDQLIFEGPALPVLDAKILYGIRDIMEDNGIPGLRTPVNMVIIKNHWAEEFSTKFEKGKVLCGKAAV